MTPLAHDLLADLTTPRRFRWHGVGDDAMARKTLWRFATQGHFFDLSAVSELVSDIGDKMLQSFEKTQRFNQRYAFLPAPTTWLEFIINSQRCAVVLTAPDANASSATFALINKLPNGAWQISDAQTSKVLRGMPTMPLVGGGKPQLSLGRASRPHFGSYAALAIINTPRVIGRRQRQPHARIERDKLRKLGLVGKFPLRAWTEIVLSVAPPDDRTGEPSSEAHLTGDKCLHFCRAHLRVRLGALEYVDAHWRGNPALGIKQSRYRIED